MLLKWIFDFALLFIYYSFEMFGLKSAPLKINIAAGSPEHPFRRVHLWCQNNTITKAAVVDDAAVNKHGDARPVPRHLRHIDFAAYVRRKILEQVETGPAIVKLQVFSVLGGFDFFEAKAFTAAGDMVLES